MLCVAMLDERWGYLPRPNLMIAQDSTSAYNSSQYRQEHSNNNVISRHHAQDTEVRSDQYRTTHSVNTVMVKATVGPISERGVSHRLSKTSISVMAFEQVKSEHIDAVKARELGEFTLTAYALSRQSTGKSPGMKGFGITYSGTRAALNRTVAVDPKVIPIGTPIYIRGLGWRLAEDIGGAVKGKHIDVLLPSDAAAIRFGVKHHVAVYTLAQRDTLQ
jgi:3D (Asp-Asp-Asp) domain-containing protein